MALHGVWDMHDDDDDAKFVMDIVTIYCSCWDGGREDWFFDTRNAAVRAGLLLQVQEEILQSERACAFRVVKSTMFDSRRCCPL
jgi:hypothetical protein